MAFFLLDLKHTDFYIINKIVFMSIEEQRIPQTFSRNNMKM